MNNVINFDFNNTNLRVIDVAGQPWFVVTDVCRVLGITNTTVAVRALDGHEWSKKNLNQIGMGLILVVSESGLYKLIMRSNKPEAKAFQNWVTQVVLPAIRKDGAYVMGEEKVVTGEMSEDELILRAQQILLRKVERLKAERDGLVETVGQFDHSLGRFAQTFPGVNRNRIKESLLKLG